MNKGKYNTVSIASFADLEKYGLNCLTGEACAYSQRLLFDVNEAGKELLSAYLGMPYISLAPNWNSSVNGQDAVGSIMLTMASAWELAVFIMLHIERTPYVIPCRENHHGVSGTDYDPAEFEFYKDVHYIVNRLPASERNQHQMSGRVV